MLVNAGLTQKAIISSQALGRLGSSCSVGNRCRRFCEPHDHPVSPTHEPDGLLAIIYENGRLWTSMVHLRAEVHHEAAY
jgi:hypothetical protein